MEHVNKRSRQGKLKQMIKEAKIKELDKIGLLWWLQNVIKSFKRIENILSGVLISPMITWSNTCMSSSFAAAANVRVTSKSLSEGSGSPEG